MEINKNMTRAEQIGHVYEYTSSMRFISEVELKMKLTLWNQ